MSNLNRFLVVCLCILMLVSMLVFPTSAASDSDTATLGSCSIAIHLYLDQRVLSAYTRLGAGADGASINVLSWQKNVTTGAIDKNEEQHTFQENPTYISVSRSPDTGYVLYRAHSCHHVSIGKQYWIADLGDIYA